MNTMKKIFLLFCSAIIITTPMNFISVTENGQRVLDSKKIVAESKDTDAVAQSMKQEIQPVPIQANEVNSITSQKNTTVEKSTISLPNKVPSKPVERTVLLSNEITKDMITYKKHWTGNYTPSKFILMANGQEVKQDTATPIKVTDDKLCVSFDYEFKVFGKVQRAGGRKLEYTVPPEIEKICSTFSWDDPTNLVLNKGLLVASKDNSY